VRRRSRQLVVDASIAHDAGSPTATHPTPVRCRAFLMEIAAQRGYAMVWTAAIAEEWRRHASPFAVRWRVQMASTQRIVDVEGERDDGLREAIVLAAATPKGARIMERSAARKRSMIAGSSGRAVKVEGRLVHAQATAGLARMRSVCAASCGRRDRSAGSRPGPMT
jgi:hypothetical protein